MLRGILVFLKHFQPPQLLLLIHCVFNGFVNLNLISKCHSTCKLIVQEKNEVEDGLVINPASAHFPVCISFKA